MKCTFFYERVATAGKRMVLGSTNRAMKEEVLELETVGVEKPSQGKREGDGH